MDCDATTASGILFQHATQRLKKILFNCTVVKSGVVKRLITDRVSMSRNRGLSGKYDLGKCARLLKIL